MRKFILAVMVMLTSTAWAGKQTADYQVVRRMAMGDKVRIMVKYSDTEGEKRMVMVVVAKADAFNGDKISDAVDAELAKPKPVAKPTATPEVYEYTYTN